MSSLVGNFFNIFFTARPSVAFDVTSYPFINYHSQNYFGIVIYLFLAAAICGLLASLAYVFSLSSVQDSEKRSEYECGFEPFDSATRLPFDVHFYLVGILFLIFDVEIALLFPWVLGLQNTGWFSFYVVLGFILLLGVGFLYEWKRGALIWPSRQTESPYVAQGKSSAIYAFGHEKHSGLSYLVQFTKNATAFSPINTTTQRFANKKLHFFTKINAAFKKIILARQIANTRRSLTRCRFLNFHSYIRAIAETETRLAQYRKTVYFFIKKALITSEAYRLTSATVSSELARQEQSFFEVIAPAAQEYSLLVLAYKNIYKKFKKSLLIRRVDLQPLIFRKKIKALRRYLFLQNRYFGRKNSKAKKEKRLLRSQINPPRKPFSWRPSSYKTTFSVFSAFVFNNDHFFSFQVFVEFLPEVLLTVAILLNLVILAIGLGEGRSKKTLVAASFFSFSRTLLFVAFLYFTELLAYTPSDVLFGGYVSVSVYVALLKLITVLTGRFILVESGKYIANHSRHLLEFPLVLTTAILFMLLLVGSNHLISAFLALVGFSLNLYVLVLFDAPAAIAREAGIKYFYLSTISSGLILYGIFLLYLLFGTGNFYEIQQLLSTEVLFHTAHSEILSLAVAFLLIGLFFKLSSFPGHLWAADVYEGAPDPLTAFFMLPVKVAVLGFVIQLLTVALEPAAALWQPVVAFSATISLIWGCFAALAEKKTKRFLAYASINQIGFLLMGLATASQEGYRATLFYLLLYAVMNVAFLIVFLNARRFDGSSLIYLTDFRGFGTKYTIFSWSVAVVLFSMAGIPPLAGFFGKYYLLLHAQEHGLSILVITGLATSLVSTYYYLRLIKIFWFEGTDGVTFVECDLSQQQFAVLTFAECILWVLSAYTAYAGFFIDCAVYSLSFDLLPTLSY